MLNFFPHSFFFFFFFKFCKNGSNVVGTKTFCGDVTPHMTSGLEGNPTYDVNTLLKQGWRPI